jgi:hypothetical protein
MSQHKRKRSHRLRGRTVPKRTIADAGTPIRLWPVAVQWYLSQERLALYRGVRVRQGPDGAAFVSLPKVGEVGLETCQLPVAMTEPGGELAAAVLCYDGAWDVLIGTGPTAAGAVDEVLGAVEQAFVDEVGIAQARAIAVSVFTEHPELADEQLARSAVRTMMIGGSSW